MTEPILQHHSEKIKPIKEQNIDELIETLRLVIGAQGAEHPMARFILRLAVLVKEEMAHPPMIVDVDPISVSFSFGASDKIIEAYKSLLDDDGSQVDRDAANEVSTGRLNDELYGERR